MTAASPWKGSHKNQEGAGRFGGSPFFVMRYVLCVMG